jgi:RES domain-containing protein
VTPLPALLGGVELVAWRLDRATLASFDSGEGAYLAGGRWNSKGIRAVYCSIDPATAILEVAVHKGFKALDTVPHELTAINITEPSSVHIVQPADIPNPNWLRPGIPSAGQQAFGDNLLAGHKFVVIPSTYPPSVGTSCSSPRRRLALILSGCKSHLLLIRGFILHAKDRPRNKCFNPSLRGASWRRSNPGSTARTLDCFAARRAPLAMTFEALIFPAVLTPKILVRPRLASSPGGPRLSRAVEGAGRPARGNGRAAAAPWPCSAPSCRAELR